MAHSSLRFGIGRFTTEAEIDFVIGKIVATVQRLRDMSPLWEMVQEGIDINTIDWAQHWKPLDLRYMMLCNFMLFIAKRAFLPHWSLHKTLEWITVLCNDVRQCDLRAMFGFTFELRVDYWVRGLPRHVLLLFLPSSPCLAVFISEVCILLFHSYYYSHHHHLQSFLRILGPKMYPNSSMDMAKLLIVVSWLVSRRLTLFFAVWDLHSLWNQSGFGFVEFENARVCIIFTPLRLKLTFTPKDAEDALYHFNGKNFMGQKYAHIPSRLSLTE
jgi:hypothetical protein